MVDPVTATLIAAGVAAAAKGTSDVMSAKSSKRAGKRRAKETKRETHAGILQDALQRGAELEAHGLQSRGRLAKRRAQSSQETSDLIREAFNI